MHPDQNPDCPLVAGTPACLFVTWTDGWHPSYPTPLPEGYTQLNNPCMKCRWWDTYSGDLEEE